jgi:hypothetical protein
MEPTPSRPHLPRGYGIEKATGAAGDRLPWSQVSEWLTSARNYWVCTSRPDGRPHAKPVWAVWLDGQILFSTHPKTITARNLQAHPALVVHLESGDQVLIVEGTAIQLDDRPLLARFGEAYQAKYDWPLSSAVSTHGTQTPPTMPCARASPSAGTQRPRSVRPSPAGVSTAPAEFNRSFGRGRESTKGMRIQAFLHAPARNRTWNLRIKSGAHQISFGSVEPKYGRLGTAPSGTLLLSRRPRSGLRSWVDRISATARQRCSLWSGLCGSRCPPSDHWRVGAAPR